MINISIALWGGFSFIFLVLSLIPIYWLVKREKKNRTLLISDLLITGQIFIGSLFLVGASAFYQQYQYTRNKDKGLNTENIWQIDLGFNAAYEKNPDQYVQILKSSPYISEVTTLTNPIFSTLRQYYCSYITRLPIYGEGDNYTDANVVVVEPNFLSFFGMRMESGEWLSENGEPEYVVNKTGAEIINLATDFSKGEVTPEKQFQYLPDIMKELNIADIYMSRIFLTLAIVCILISSLGIYLLVALSTEQRKKEMAVRIINGAVFVDILKLFLNRYFVLTLIANALSLPLGYLFVYRWLQTYAYHFELSFLMFVLVLLITIMIVVLSVAIQVTRVLKMNPVENLKSE
ncbi:MAG: FtsX-like permease family protein [Petrimonas sp.]|nr:FtsX-like permease family protein [Petrimonas sp.]